MSSAFIRGSICSVACCCVARAKGPKVPPCPSTTQPISLHPLRRKCHRQNTKSLGVNLPGSAPFERSLRLRRCAISRVFPNSRAMLGSRRSSSAQLERPPTRQVVRGMEVTNSSAEKNSKLERSAETCDSPAGASCLAMIPLHINGRLSKG